MQKLKKKPADKQPKKAGILQLCLTTKSGMMLLTTWSCFYDCLSFYKRIQHTVQEDNVLQFIAEVEITLEVQQLI